MQAACTRLILAREFPIEVSFAEHICIGGHFFTGITRDVADRQRAEESLRASEQHLRETNWPT